MVVSKGMNIDDLMFFKLFLSGHQYWGNSPLASGQLW